MVLGGVIRLLFELLFGAVAIFFVTSLVSSGISADNVDVDVDIDVEQAGYCFEDLTGAFSVGGTEVIPADFTYGRVKTNWKYEVKEGEPQILVTDLTSSGFQRDEALGNEYENSSENCGFFSFRYERLNQELHYVLSNVGKTDRSCLYGSESEIDEIILDIGSVGGAPFGDLSLMDRVFVEDIEAENDASGIYLVDEKVIGAEAGCSDSVGFEQVGEIFIDGLGNEYRHCVKRGVFAEGSGYVKNSYLHRAVAAPECPEGENKGFFEDDNGVIVMLCVDRGEVKSFELIENVSIAEDCPLGMKKTGEAIEVGGGTIVHCSATNFLGGGDGARKGLTPLCNNLESGGDKLGNGCGSSAVCEIDIPKGTFHYYGFNVERDGCGSMKIDEDNDGNPIGLSGIGFRAEAFIGECSLNYLELECVGPNEEESNDDFSEANFVGLRTCPDSGDIDGGITSEDVDIFSLGGPFSKGDVITVEVDGLADLDVAVGVFNQEGAALYINDDRNYFARLVDPYISFSLRGDEDEIFVAIVSSPTSVSVGTYEAELTTRTGTVFSPNSQRVLLDFDGASDIAFGGRQPVDIPAFEDSWFGEHEKYSDRLEEMKVAIREKVEEDFVGFNVEVFTTDEALPEEPYTSVYMGGYDPALLGVAENVDEFNQHVEQEVIVFIDTFVVFEPLEPSLDEMTTAIKNVASHEIAHTLGLVHTEDVEGIMDITASLRGMMAKQDFRTSNLERSTFPIGMQDARGLLSLGVGETS